VSRNRSGDGHASGEVAEVTLDWEPFLGAGPAINEALIAGSLDVANYADTAGILGRTAGADTSLVAIHDPLIAAWLVVSRTRSSAPSGMRPRSSPAARSPSLHFRRRDHPSSQVVAAFESAARVSDSRKGEQDMAESGARLWRRVG
jgi:hypothetical protein